MKEKHLIKKSENVDPLTEAAFEDLSFVAYPPKYNPRRKFKKGDIVKLVEWHGRLPYDTDHHLMPSPGEVHIVLADEYERNEVYIGMSSADEHQSVVHACHLELITSIEDLAPYRVESDQYGFHIENKAGEILATYNDSVHPDAHKAAEDECTRLNMQYAGNKYKKELKY